MTAYSLAVQANVRKRMSPPNRQDVPQISKELGIHRSTLYQWRSNWRLRGAAARGHVKPDRNCVQNLYRCLDQLDQARFGLVARRRI